MSDGIDMVSVVGELAQRPRGRACIVLTREYREQKTWAARLAGMTNSGHIDLLELFSQSKKLAINVSRFTVSELFSFLNKYGDSPVLIVSGMEFLIASWVAQSKAIDLFAEGVKTRSRSPALLFVVQYDKALAEYDFGRRFQYTYIVDQRETLAL